jgi:hypothetical protein
VQRRLKQAFAVFVASALVTVGLQSPAAATTWADCTYVLYIDGGSGCFIKTGDDIGAHDASGDGYHARLWFRLYPASGGMTTDYCEAFYGETRICNFNFPANARISISLWILDNRDGYTEIIRNTTWSPLYSVGG